MDLAKDSHVGAFLNQRSDSFFFFQFLFEFEKEVKKKQKNKEEKEKEIPRQILSNY